MQKIVEQIESQDIQPLFGKKVNIIHMGGRIYDPILGSLLQADPIVYASKTTNNIIV